MKPVIHWIQKNVFGISLYIAVVSLIFEYLYFANYEPSETLEMFDVIFGLYTVSLEFLLTDYFHFKVPIDEYSSYHVSYLNFILYGLMLIGAVLYQWSNKNATRVLTFTLSVVFIASVIAAVNGVYQMIFVDDAVVYTDFILLIKRVLLFFVCLLLLRKLLSRQELLQDEIETIGTEESEFQTKRSEWYLRAFHFLVDSFIMITVFSLVVFYEENSIAKLADEYLGDRISASVVFAVFATIYYLFFEGILKTTPGKILTQSQLVSLNDEPIDFSGIFIRTFSRRVPFNAISFFGKLGWHDSFSGITVGKLKETDEKYRIFYWILLIAILAVFSVSIYLSIS